MILYNMVKIFNIAKNYIKNLSLGKKVYLIVLVVIVIILLQPVYKALRDAIYSGRYRDTVEQNRDNLKFIVEEKKLLNDKERGEFHREKFYRVIQQKTKEGEGVISLRGLSNPENPDELFTEGDAYFQIIR